MFLRHLLIDWLTLRIPVCPRQFPALFARVSSALGLIHCYGPDGAMQWEKRHLDVDALRSDTVGVMWQLQSDGKQDFLVIGGSPASLSHGINVFGSLDIRTGANVLIRGAAKRLRMVLPPLEQWSCRRIDITGNYALPDFETVKTALRMLAVSDGSRRRASSPKNGGDSVCWQPGSDLAKGKAYHKGPQLAYLAKKGTVNPTQEQLAAADRLLRLEHTRGSRWFRRLEATGAKWWQLTGYELWKLYKDFFGRLVQGVEVREMDREKLVRQMMKTNNITQGRAEAAFTTLRNIREDGFDVVKGYMAESTFYLHLKHLRAVGVTDADMHTAKILPFRPIKIVLAEPVGSWAELGIAA